MSNIENKIYYVITHGGEPVLYGDKVHLHPNKKDIKITEGDKIEEVRLVREKKTKCS